MNWIRERIRKWLGIEALQTVSDDRFNSLRKAQFTAEGHIAQIQNQLAEQMQIGADVNVKGDQTQIVVMSRLSGGRVQIINARFAHLVQLEEFIREIEQRYGASAQDLIADMPRGMKFDHLRRRGW